MMCYRLREAKHIFVSTETKLTIVSMETIVKQHIDLFNPSIKPRKPYITLCKCPQAFKKIGIASFAQNQKTQL